MLLLLEVLRAAMASRPTFCPFDSACFFGFVTRNVIWRAGDFPAYMTISLVFAAGNHGAGGAVLYFARATLFSQAEAMERHLCTGLG